MSRLLLIMLFLLVAGCNSTVQQNTVAVPENILADEYFKATTHEIETPQEIFALSDDMKNYVDKRLLKIDDPYKRSKQIIKDIFSKSELNVFYESHANLTAAQTFEAGIANCLSLTIMVKSLAREAGLVSQFQSVSVPENWTLNGNTVFANGHVNLRITGTARDRNVMGIMLQGVTVDFIPELGRMAKSKSRFISEEDMVALFYNNKGAEALAVRDLPLAYQYLSAAIKLAPEVAASYNNLALLYRKVGLIDKAEDTLLYGMQQPEAGLNMQENLAYIYRATGREAQAQVILENLASKRKDNPYYHLMLAQTEFNKGLYQGAIKHYRRALKLDRKNHQVYLGLALSYVGMDDLQMAEHYMEKAKKNVRSEQLLDKYDGKLQVLRGLVARL